MMFNYNELVSLDPQGCSAMIDELVSAGPQGYPSYDWLTGK